MVVHARSEDRSSILNSDIVKEVQVLSHLWIQNRNREAVVSWEAWKINPYLAPMDKLYLSSSSSKVIYDDDDIPCLQELKNKEHTTTFYYKVMIENFETKKRWNYPSCGYEKCIKGATRQHGKWLREACNKTIDCPVFSIPYAGFKGVHTVGCLANLFIDGTALSAVSDGVLEDAPMKEVAGQGGRRKEVAGRGGRRKKVTGHGARRKKVAGRGGRRKKPKPYLFLDQLEIDVTGIIVVMIDRVWDVNAISRRYLSMDFVGNMIICTAKSNVAHNFLRLKEGGIYYVKNSVVLPNKDEFRIFKHDMFMLEFEWETTTRKVSADPVGYLRYPFQLMDFDHIKPANNKYLIDITGYVTNVGRTTYTKSGSKTLDFYLVNQKLVLLSAYIYCICVAKAR
nr:hypothetical protein [Tanacetum cinerariifolium]